MCKASAVAQWTAIYLGQDGAFASGMIAGVPAAMYDAAEGFVKMGLGPVETFDSLKLLVMSSDLVGNVADSIKQSYIECIDRLVREYKRAGECLGALGQGQ